jgi:transposase
MGLTREIELIASIPVGLKYNIAKGGDGGHTMTQAQLDAQYALQPEQYSEFRQLFLQRVPALRIAAHFGVSHNAVRRCASRLGLSFKQRRARQKPNGLRGTRTSLSRARFNPKERSRLRAQVAARNNVARGIPVPIKERVLDLYFQQHLTAKEVAAGLGVSRGSVRATVNQAYKGMTPEEHAALKHVHGSQVRSGPRNSNAKRPGS